MTQRGRAKRECRDCGAPLPGAVSGLITCTECDKRYRVRAPSQNGGPPEKSTGLYVTWANTVRAERVEFGWEGRIPLGMVSLLAGQPGYGKSTLFAWLAASLSKGELAGQLLGTPVTVLMASAEDPEASVGKPRLMAAGAELKRVGFLAVEHDEATGTLTLPDDIERLDHTMEKTGARALFIDPIAAYLSVGTNDYRDADVRRVLGRLAKVAKKHHAAIVVLKHLNKGESTDPLTRISGSGGYGAAPRSVLFVGPDPSDPDGPRGSQRIIAHSKCNVGPEQPSLMCQIETVGVESDDDVLTTSRLVVVGESDLEAHQLLDARPTEDERTARDDAADWLVDALRMGARATQDLLTDGKRAGINRRTLYRARGRLGLVSVDLDEQDGRRKAWALPDAVEGEK